MWVCLIIHSCMKIGTHSCMKFVREFECVWSTCTYFYWAPRTCVHSYVRIVILSFLKYMRECECVWLSIHVWRSELNHVWSLWENVSVSEVGAPTSTKLPGFMHLYMMIVTDLCMNYMRECECVWVCRCTYVYGPPRTYFIYILRHSLIHICICKWSLWLIHMWSSWEDLGVSECVEAFTSTIIPGRTSFTYWGRHSYT